VCVGAIYLEDFNCCVTGQLHPHWVFYDLECRKYLIFASSVVYFRPLYLKVDTQRASETYLCVCIYVCVCVYLRHSQYKNEFSDNDS